MTKEDLNEHEKIAYDIVEKQLEVEMDKIRTNPLFQEWSASSFRDILIFGEHTPETIALEKKLLESLKQKS
jgi:hypothetical protein